MPGLKRPLQHKFRTIESEWLKLKLRNGSGVYVCQVTQTWSLQVCVSWEEPIFFPGVRDSSPDTVENLLVAFCTGWLPGERHSYGIGHAVETDDGAAGAVHAAAPQQRRLLIRPQRHGCNCWPTSFLHYNLVMVRQHKHGMVIQSLENTKLQKGRKAKQSKARVRGPVLSYMRNYQGDRRLDFLLKVVLQEMCSFFW